MRISIVTLLTPDSQSTSLHSSRSLWTWKAALIRKLSGCERLWNPPLLNPIHEVPGSRCLPCPKEKPRSGIFKGIELCLHVFPNSIDHRLFPIFRVSISLALAAIYIAGGPCLCMSIWISANVCRSSPFTNICGHYFIGDAQHVCPFAGLFSMLVLSEFFVLCNKNLYTRSWLVE